MMADHLNPASERYFGIMAHDGKWRLTLGGVGGYGLQVRDAVGWVSVETFPSASFLHCHVSGVYDCGPFLSAIAADLPPNPYALSSYERRDLRYAIRRAAQRPKGVTGAAFGVRSGRLRLGLWR